MLVNISEFSLVLVSYLSLSSSTVDEDSGVETICLMGAPVVNLAKPCCYTTDTLLLEAGGMMQQTSILAPLRVPHVYLCSIEIQQHNSFLQQLDIFMAGLHQVWLQPPVSCFLCWLDLIWPVTSFLTDFWPRYSCNGALYSCMASIFAWFVSLSPYSAIQMLLF